MACEHKINPVDQLLYKRCMECRREIRRKHYTNNKEKILEKQAEYRKNNPEKVRAIKEAYNERMKALRINNRNKLTIRQKQNINKLRAVIHEIYRIERAYHGHNWAKKSSS